MNGQPRCPIRGCFIVYRGGDDRLCPIHQEEQAACDIAQRMTDLGLASGPDDYTAAMAPGDSDGDHPGDPKATIPRPVTMAE